jgi:hypothetical protein
MGSKHRRQNRDDRLFERVFVTVSVAVAFAAVVSAALVYFTGWSSADSHHTANAAPLQPVSQEGTVVAVSPDSMTARSSNGFARTYEINSETTAITGSGSRVGGVGSVFTVDDRVSIFAVVRDGTAIATTVAGRDATNLQGPPMDGAGAARLG